jgi:hypothetical protein
MDHTREFTEGSGAFRQVVQDADTANSLKRVRGQGK